MKDSYYEGRVAVVTGAGGTLCSEIAVDLAQKGARVVLVGRTREKLERTAQRIAADGGAGWVYPCDVTDEAAVRAMAAEVAAQWGSCRFLVNGAGGNRIAAMTTIPAFDPAELADDRPESLRGFFNLSMADFAAVLQANTMGTVIPTQAFAQQMAADGGVVLNFASMNTYRPLSRVAPYAMSKAAVANLTQWLAAYLAPAHIRVNAVAPGFMVNERSRQYLGTVEDGLTARGERVIAHTPMGRFGQAADLLGAVSYLLDDRAAAFVTGITLPVDGGFLTQPGI